MRHLHKQLNHILTSLIVLLSVMILYLIVQVKILEHPYPLFNRFTVFHVVSDSMTGTYNNGSIIIVEKINTTTLQVGDVITFRAPQDEKMVITHRITGKNGTEFVTKGDANQTVDSVSIRAEQIVGRVVFGIPFIGSIISNPVLILFIAFCIFIIGLQTRKKKKIF